MMILPAGLTTGPEGPPSLLRLSLIPVHDGFIYRFNRYYTTAPSGLSTTKLHTFKQTIAHAFIPVTVGRAARHHEAKPVHARAKGVPGDPEPLGRPEGHVTEAAVRVQLRHLLRADRDLDVPGPVRRPRRLIDLPAQGGVLPGQGEFRRDAPRRGGCFRQPPGANGEKDAEAGERLWV